MPIAIKMAGKEIASYDTTTDKVSIKLSDDVSINDSAGNAVLNESGGVVTFSSSTLDGIKLNPSGDSITKSDGTTAVLSESVGVVTLNNITAGSNISGIGQLVGVSYVDGMSGNGNYVTLENNKDYILFVSGYASAGSVDYGWTEYYEFSVDGSGTVTGNEPVSLLGSITLNTANNAVRVASSTSDQGYFAGLVFEQGSTFDAS